VSKPRFRDVKQGRVKQNIKESKESQKKSYATLRDRFKAFITDSFMILMPIMYIVFYLVFDGREGFAQHKMLGWLYILVPYILISSIFIAKASQTPGMKAYNLCVIKTDGTKVDFSTALLRQLLAVWDFFLFTWIIEFFRKDRRTLHEILSSTELIECSSNKVK